MARKKKKKKTKTTTTTAEMRAAARTIAKYLSERVAESDMTPCGEGNGVIIDIAEIGGICGIAGQSVDAWGVTRRGCRADLRRRVAEWLVRAVEVAT